MTAPAGRLSPPRASALALATLALVMSACATSPYQRAGNADDVAGAVARAHPPVATTRSLAFLVLGGASGPRLAEYDLAASRVVWTQPTDVTTRVEVGTTVIVHGDKGTTPNGEMVGRDLATGAALWRHAFPSAEHLYGYAIDGDTLFVVTRSSTTQSKQLGILAAYDGRTGVLRWQATLPSARVAGPAARGGLVAVPLESQYVLLFDGATGLELGQVLSTEEAATFVRALPEGMFYGSRGLFLLGRDTARGSRHAPGYLSAQLPAFVRPTYFYDLYHPEQSEYSALDRNRLLWRVVVDAGHPQFRDGLAFVHDYRFFFAFDAASAALRWAYVSPDDAVGSADTGRSILFVTASGEIGALDPITGARTYQAQLPGEVVRGASFDAEGFAPPAGAGASTPPDLLGALTAIIADPDQRFPALKLFAIEELGRQPGREVTAKLIEILRTEKTAPLALQKAGEMLVARRDAGALDLLTAALRAHADYCEKRSAPPVEVLARAIGALGPLGRAVAPDLDAHLRLPETSPAAAAEIARALVQIGAGESVPALRDFLTMYRADAVYERDPTALVAAAEALLKLGGSSDRQLLLFLAEEPHTAAGLRAHLSRALGETATAAKE
ncbi:MAG TPA: PQQ-binding-like beta-propeller repeat protein [Polyangia bacterium]|jgi:outer membrane protein assembly factor BamB|nr:PQQ-binding-like beta-propeller repeat protein [Polyangia bacterium]